MTIEQRIELDRMMKEAISRCDNPKEIESLISKKLENALIMEMGKDMAKRLNEFIMGSENSKPVGKISGDIKL